MQTYTHFRCAFDVSPVGDILSPWPALIGEIRAWISRKESPDPAELKGWFFSGGSWTGPGPSRPHIEVRTLSEAGGGPTPELWALRYEHPDREHIARRWITNVGVVQIGQREWRFSLELVHVLRPDFVGAEPKLPQPSSPGLVTGLLSGVRWVCRAGNQRLLSTPLSIAVGKGPQLVALIVDPMRLCPLVLVSRSHLTGDPKVSPDGLARALAGTASVHVPESPESDDELEYLVPYKFRSPNGTVRIYAPSVDFGNEWSAGRHRFFLPKDIEAQGPDEIQAQIVRALTRSDAWQGLQSSIRSIEDIESRVRERRLAELRSSHELSIAEKDEWVKLFSAENSSLEDKKKELESELSSTRGQLREAKEGADRLEYEVAQLSESNIEVRRALRERSDAVEAVKGLKTWPDEPVEVAAFAEQIFADKIVITEQARRSLARSKIVHTDDGCNIVWRCLSAMAKDLHDLVVAQDPPEQNAAELFRQKTGFELTWTETKETKRDNKLMALRRMTHDGQEIDITPHVKWGNKPPKCLRVHFFVDRQRGRLVIGHCGDHLDTYGTDRRS